MASFKCSKFSVTVFLRFRFKVPMKTVTIISKLRIHFVSAALFYHVLFWFLLFHFYLDFPFSYLFPSF